MRSIKFLSSFATFLVAAMPALSNEKMSAKELLFLHSATKVTIQQINPRGSRHPDRENGASGDIALKSVELTGSDCTKVVNSLINGINSGAEGARCFKPRHVLLIQSGKEQQRYVICYECHWVYSDLPGGDQLERTISSSGQSVLDAYLKPLKVIPGSN